MIKKTVFILLSAFYSIAHAAHGQLVSMETQCFANDLPTAIALHPVANGLSGMTWNKKKMMLSIQDDGVYEFIALIQYGIKDTAEADGSMCYWLEVNGKPLMETVQLISVPLQTKTNLVRYNSALPMKAGSQIRFMCSSTSPDIELLSVSSTKPGPSVASVSMSIFKIGNIVTYL